MRNREENIILTGTALAEVQMQAKNDKGEVVYNGVEIAVVNIECEAIKHIEYDSYEVYSIDNSFYDYDEKDIRIDDGYEFVLIDLYEFDYLRQLLKDKDIQKYINKKMGQNKNSYPMEAVSIKKIIKYDLIEDF